MFGWFKRNKEIELGENLIEATGVDEKLLKHKYETGDKIFWKPSGKRVRIEQVDSLKQTTINYFHFKDKEELKRLIDFLDRQKKLNTVDDEFIELCKKYDVTSKLDYSGWKDVPSGLLAKSLISPFENEFKNVRDTRQFLKQYERHLEAQKQRDRRFEVDTQNEEDIKKLIKISEDMVESGKRVSDALMKLGEHLEISNEHITRTDTSEDKWFFPNISVSGRNSGKSYNLLEHFRKHLKDSGNYVKIEDRYNFSFEAEKLVLIGYNIFVKTDSEGATWRLYRSFNMNEMNEALRCALKIHNECKNKISDIWDIEDIRDCRRYLFYSGKKIEILLRYSCTDFDEPKRKEIILYDKNRDKILMRYEYNNENVKEAMIMAVQLNEDIYKENRDYITDIDSLSEYLEKNGNYVRVELIESVITHTGFGWTKSLGRIYEVDNDDFKYITFQYDKSTFHIVIKKALDLHDEIFYKKHKKFLDKVNRHR